MELHPENAEARSNPAMIYYFSGQNEEAPPRGEVALVFANCLDASGAATRTVVTHNRI